VRNFVNDIHRRFTGLNKNQRLILLATVFLIMLNFIIFIMGIKIIFTVLEKIR
jgi:hypothetical protein